MRIPISVRTKHGQAIVDKNPLHTKFRSLSSVMFHQNETAENNHSSK